MIKTAIEHCQENDFEYDTKKEEESFRVEAIKFFEAKTVEARLVAFARMDFTRLISVVKLAHNGLSQDKLYDIASLDLGISVLKKELGSEFAVLIGFVEDAIISGFEGDLVEEVKQLVEKREAKKIADIKEAEDLADKETENKPKKKS